MSSSQLAIRINDVYLAGDHMYKVSRLGGSGVRVERLNSKGNTPVLERVSRSGIKDYFDAQRKTHGKLFPTEARVRITAKGTEPVELRCMYNPTTMSWSTSCGGVSSKESYPTAGYAVQKAFHRYGKLRRIADGKKNVFNMLVTEPLYDLLVGKRFVGEVFW